MPLIVEDKRKLRNQKKIQLAFETRVFDFFDSAEHTLTELFPKTELLIPTQDSSGKQSVPIGKGVAKEFHHCKTWIKQVFDKAIEVSIKGDYDETPPESMHFISKIQEGIIHNLLKVLSESGSLSDCGLMFIGDVGKALGLDSQSIDIHIEQVQYERRKEFTKKLLELLSEEQLYWVALMLWNAVHIDDKVDYREYKYFENILQLIHYEQKKLIQLKKDSDNPITLPDPLFDAWLCVQVYRYIVEIVMIDEEYSPKEATFIQHIGDLLGYDKTQQDKIIQPIAAALMVRKSLFSY